jgi:hypothetical protein
MRGVAALVAAAVLGLFSANAAAQSAPCVNETDALIASRNTIVQDMTAFAQQQCGPNNSSWWWVWCISAAPDAATKSDAVKKMDKQIAQKGDQCFAQSKQETSAIVKDLANCRVAPDGPTTIQCKTLASFQRCQKAKPWSPGNCHIWNGEPMAPCCKLYNWQ